jgi:hypothetical protein
MRRKRSAVRKLRVPVPFHAVHAVLGLERAQDLVERHRPFADVHVVARQHDQVRLRGRDLLDHPVLPPADALQVEVREVDDAEPIVPQHRLADLDLRAGRLDPVRLNQGAVGEAEP